MDRRDRVDLNMASECPLPLMGARRQRAAKRSIQIGSSPQIESSGQRRIGVQASIVVRPGVVDRLDSEPAWTHERLE